MPLIDPTSDSSFVHNATLVSTRVETANVEKEGFPTSSSFLDWITNAPIAIQLNRPCRSGEEIVVDYRWLFEKELGVDETLTPPYLSPDTPQHTTKKSPRLLATQTAAKVSAKAVTSLLIQSPCSAEEEKNSGTPTTNASPDCVEEETPNFSKEERDRVENCAECSKEVAGLHKCDKCKRKMHGYCGIGIGDEMSTQV